MKPITKENIDEDPWFGGQRDRVLALLNIIESQGELIATQDNMLKDHAGREGRLFDRLQALVRKIQVIHDSPEYMTVWQCAQMHLGAYKGQDYRHELDEATKALRK